MNGKAVVIEFEDARRALHSRWSTEPTEAKRSVVLSALYVEGYSPAFQARIQKLLEREIRLGRINKKGGDHERE